LFDVYELLSDCCCFCSDSLILDINTMLYKIQPRIRIQESPCIFDGITSILSIKRHAYVALTVLAIVCSTAWCKIVMQHSLVVYHEISYLSLVFSWYADSSKGSCMYTEKIQVTCGILHGISLESVA